MLTHLEILAISPKNLRNKSNNLAHTSSNLLLYIDNTYYLCYNKQVSIVLTTTLLEKSTHKGGTNNENCFCQKGPVHGRVCEGICHQTHHKRDQGEIHHRRQTDSEADNRLARSRGYHRHSH
nr:MAG TPA: hypothetical protein [Caudoviricetes sp.]